MKFVGHLDIMRYFQKAIRRSGIRAAFSQGFSPHMIMSFAEPLGVSIMSEGEYFDLETDYADNEAPSSVEMRDMLQKVMVPGIDIIDIKAVDEGKKSKAMSLVGAASYRICGRDENDCLVPFYRMTPLSEEAFKSGLDRFISMERINAVYKSKKGTKDIDIKERIISLCTDKNGYLDLFCHAGSVSNLRPAIVTETLCRFLEIPYNELDWQYIRTDLYAKTENGYVPLSELGEDF